MRTHETDDAADRAQALADKLGAVTPGTLDANDRWSILCNEEWSRSGLIRSNTAHRLIVWRRVAQQLSDDRLRRLELLPEAMDVVGAELSSREAERWWV